jgi:hypothetical protein
VPCPIVSPRGPRVCVTGCVPNISKAGTGVQAEAERESTTRLTWESLVVRRRLLSFSLAMLVVCSMAGCGPSSGQGSLPRAVMSAVDACHQVVGGNPPGAFQRIKRVHLVLTTYAKSEVAASDSGANSMSPNTLVWVVEVHAERINWNHSFPAGYKPPKEPDTDFWVVKNARTGFGADMGECRCWPLPLGKVGHLISRVSGDQKRAACRCRCRCSCHRWNGKSRRRAAVVAGLWPM